mmetsp:Transcript_28188/g.39656  ORF Transcript_28188/g.39656 Transcript_28188/m.39656 type:complete len:306 (+) Transcript_28188:40-957(+)
MCIVRRSSIPKNMTSNITSKQARTNKKHEENADINCAFPGNAKKDTFVKRTKNVNNERASSVSPKQQQQDQQKIMKIRNRSSTRKAIRAQRNTQSNINNCDIRARFLNRLGIQATHTFPPQQQDRNRLLSKRAELELHEPLKYDHGIEGPIEDDDDINSCASTVPLSFNDSCSSSCTVGSTPSFHEDNYIDATKATSPVKKQNHRRSVSFEKTVSVRTIPKRNAYSSRIQKDLWATPNEVHQSTNRNILEFSADRWDWKHVTEEEDMVYNYQTKEYIHPIHVQTNRCNVRQQFFMVMSAQQQQYY